MWKALVLVVKSTTSLGRPYHPPGSAIYFDFSLSRCCITLFWGFLSNKNLVFTSCGTLFLLVYYNLTLKLRLIASQRSNRHHLKMSSHFIGWIFAWFWTRFHPFFSFASLLAQWKSPFTWWFSGQKKKSNAIQVLAPDRKFAMELRISVHWCANWRLGACT